MWQQTLTAYLVAKARRAEASRRMASAQRRFLALARCLPEDAAYLLAGVGLAERRSLAACTDERRALEALKDSLRGAGYVARLTAAGAVLCADLPRAANDR